MGQQARLGEDYQIDGDERGSHKSRLLEGFQQFLAGEEMPADFRNLVQKV